jgi:hypothetical protein
MVVALSGMIERSWLEIRLHLFFMIGSKRIILILSEPTCLKK